MPRKFILEIDCDNAAFEDFHGELHACLGRAQAQIAAGYDRSKILDTNGNAVGHFYTRNVWPKNRRGL